MKNENKTYQGRERRFVSDLVKRNEGQESRRIGGYAALVNVPTLIREDDFEYEEVILPGAFDDAVQASDIRALLNHDVNELLGRTASGTLALIVDDKGLSYVVDVPKTRDDVLEMVERGDLSESSFQFSILEERWTEREGQPELREIIKMDRIYDVAPVTFAAYPDTTVAKRSHAAYIAVSYTHLTLPTILLV